MNLGTKLNNYLNIRYAKQNDWLGQMGQEDGFVKFTSPERSIRAGMVIILGYLKRGVNTVEKIISTWAPTTENDTAAYIKNVCAWTGFRPDDPINRSSVGKLVAAMARQETGNVIDQEIIEQAWAEMHEET